MLYQSACGYAVKSYIQVELCYHHPHVVMQGKIQVIQTILIMWFKSACGYAVQETKKKS